MAQTRRMGKHTQWADRPERRGFRPTGVVRRDNLSTAGILVVLSDKPPLDPSQELRKPELHQALSKLPFEFRETLALREIEGWSYGPLAFALRLPTDEVTSRRSEARLRLRQEMMEVRPRGDRE